MSFSGRNPIGLVRQLVQANGWRVILQDGDHHVLDDPAGSLPCDIEIVYEEGSPVMVIWAGVSQALPASTLPASIFAGLLARHPPFGNFRTDPVGNSHLRFVLVYTALAAGLTGVLFRQVCGQMSAEVGLLEAALRQEGLLVG
jgi:hypothetical protein